MNKNLPVYETKNEIISAVKKCDTVILTAETGSGKSTQIPQYLFEAGYDVIVTQPRRIACITLAERVAEEMEELSNIVGYHTAFESNRTPDTRILFCTDGLQMAKGIKDTENTILVLDEVHEWNLNIETLVAWIKKFRKDGGRIKVILMSATVESQSLSEFYGDAICIDIPGRNYEVEKIHEGYSSVSNQVYKYASSGKNVLAFVEGKKEIEDVINNLTERELNAEILPLHGELSSHDQNICFRHFDRAKVVVATNIAQTSVTIPDIDVVVDNGKEKRIEVNDGIEGLFVRNISRADCLQRAGRAGRTKNGIYVLCSYSDLDDRDEYSTPEIQRLVLDKVVLKLASVGIDARSLDFFHQPDTFNIIKSIETLIMLGALDEQAKITDLGKRMIKMPVSVRFAKMIIEAEKYGCVDKMIKAVAIMEIGTLIRPKILSKDAIFRDDYVSYKDFTKEDKSDVLAEIDIYDQITSFKIPDLKAAGINKKSFFRIKEVVEKLNQVLDGIVEMSCDEPSKFDFIKCIAVGIPDQLFKCYGYDNNCEDICEREYKISRNNCIRHQEFVFGFPRTITFKDRWGYDQTMDIITMPSNVTADELISIVGQDKIETDYSASSASYDAATDSFIIPYTKHYCNFTLDKGYKTISKDDEGYEKCKKELSDLVDKENAKRVIINGNVYEIEDPFWGGHPTLYISSEDVIKSDLKSLKDAAGRQVEFHCGGYKNVNLDIIRNRIIEDRVKSAEEAAMNRVPHGKTGSAKLVINEYLDKLGKIDVGVPEYNIVKFKWVGLVTDKQSVAFSSFESEEEMIESTNEALQMLIGSVIITQYPDKKFIIKRDGKKIETKASQAAKNEFHEFCQEIIKDTTKDNFAEQLEFLDEIFNECIQQFAS